MGFIEDFYYGRLHPQQRRVPPDSEAMRRSEKLADSEARLLEMLPETEKELFREIRELWQDTLAEDCLDSFVTGFRYGARFAHDAFASDEAPYKDVGKGR